MKKNLFVSLFVISMTTLGILACSSDSDHVEVDGMNITAPFVTAEIDTLSLDLLPEWIAEKVKPVEELGDLYHMFSVYQCMWKGNLYYFIFDPLKSCIYCDSVYYPDGKVVEWEDEEQTQAFGRESTDWILLYRYGYK
jgi:hypothetical protein